jgi:hypothetical protein
MIQSTLCFMSASALLLFAFCTQLRHCHEDCFMNVTTLWEDFGWFLVIAVIVIQWLLNVLKASVFPLNKRHATSLHAQLI